VHLLSKPGLSACDVVVRQEARCLAKKGLVSHMCAGAAIQSAHKRRGTGGQQSPLYRGCQRLGHRVRLERRRDREAGFVSAAHEYGGGRSCKSNKQHHRKWNVDAYAFLFFLWPLGRPKNMLRENGLLHPPETQPTPMALKLSEGAISLALAEKSPVKPILQARHMRCFDADTGVGDTPRTVVCTLRCRSSTSRRFLRHQTR